MAYAEAVRSNQDERPHPTVKAHIIDTRDNLIAVRNRLVDALARLRGHTLENQTGAQVQPPEPDHIVWGGESTVRLSTEVLNLANELADYI